MSLSPRLLRLTIAVLALGAIAYGFATSETTEITFVYTTDATDVLHPLIERFNEEQRSVLVHEEAVPSGTQLQAMVDGARPNLWMPAASTWVSLLNASLAETATRPDPRTYFWSPEVIATWEGLEGDLASFADIAALAHDDEALGDRRPFRFGHARPTVSTSGLFALVAEYEAAIGEGPVDQDAMARPTVLREVRDVEGSVRHYGNVTQDFCPQLASYTSAYVTAVYMQETVLEGCQETDSPLRLVAVTPEGGTFVADYPLVRFSWSTPEEQEAADAFESWLASELQPEDAENEHLRFGSPWEQPCGEAPGLAEYRCTPEVGVLLEALATWPEETRKPANVLVVLDSSRETSKDGRIDLARDFLGELLDLIPTAKVDVGLMIFDEAPRMDVPIAPLADNRDELDAAIADVAPRSDEAVLYDAVRLATEQEEMLDQSAIDVVVVVSLGDDDGSATTWSELEQRVESLSADPPSPLQIMTVSLTEQGPGRTTMTDIAEAAYGAAYVLTEATEGPTSAPDIAKQIASLV